MKNSGKFFIGIFAAATAGVVIGMLIAPEKGEDLRKNISNSLGNWSKKVDDLMAEGKVQLEGIKSMFDQVTTDGKSQVGDGFTNGKG